MVDTNNGGETMLRRPKASGRFEAQSWFFMRLSGLLLVILVLIHFGIMHLYYGVTHIDFSVVAARYGTPFWRIYDLVLVALALTHGLNGARVVIDDYVHPRGWRTVCLSALAVIGLVLMAMGTYTIMAFGGK